MSIQLYIFMIPLVEKFVGGVAGYIDNSTIQYKILIRPEEDRDGYCAGGCRQTDGTCTGKTYWRNVGEQNDKQTNFASSSEKSSSLVLHRAA